MQNETEVEATETDRWLCLGRRLGSKGKLVTAWTPWRGSLDATATDTHDDEVMFFAKFDGQPGRLYDVQIGERDEDGLVVKGRPSYVETLDADDRLEFELADRTAGISLEVNRQEARDKKDSALTDMVAPLREAYRKKITPSQRAAFLALVQEMITR
jgi:hypothetical protein